MYDVGRVLMGPFQAGYQFIAEQGEQYVKDQEALDRIRAFHQDRKVGINQDDFNWLNLAWVKAIESGELIFDREKLIYSDVQPRFELVKKRGDLIYLHTSGSKELISLLLGLEIRFDGLLIGEETGDKNHPETFAQIWEDLECQIKAFYDDKLRVVKAAYEGFSLAGGNPSLYLVDRQQKLSDEESEEILTLGISKISSFTEIQDR